MTRRHVQAVVVGGGPVGLLAALALNDRGIEVEVVERRSASDAGSHLILLHARTLRLLERLRVLEAVAWQGRAVHKLALYAQGGRRATLDLARGSEELACLTVPQEVLRRAVERALSSRHVPLHYNTRLTSLEQDAGRVTLRLARQERLELGSPAAFAEWVDARPLEVEASFVIGADGYDSAVRSALDIELLAQGPARTFAFFDAPTDARIGATAELCFEAGVASSVFPLHGGRSRWSFQLTDGLHEALDDGRLNRLIAERMPWHREQFAAVEWAGVAEFRSAVVSRFGRGRVWLAGDAAHLTRPLGAQSVNVGLHEADELAAHVRQCIDGASTEALELRYETRRRCEWDRLLDLGAPATARPHAAPWVSEHAAELVASLPASGPDLESMLAHLGIALH